MSMMIMIVSIVMVRTLILCRTISTVKAVHEIVGLKNMTESKALSPMEMNKMMSAVKLLKARKGIQESKHPGVDCLRIGTNCPDSSSDRSDKEADRHIWNDTREIVCEAIGGRVMPTLYRYRRIQRAWRAERFQEKKKKNEMPGYRKATAESRCQK